MVNPNTKHEGAQEAQAIKNKGSNGEHGGLWMKLKWGGIFRISDLDKTEKSKERESNKDMQRIGFYCYATYLYIEDIQGNCLSTSESTIQRNGSWPHKIRH